MRTIILTCLVLAMAGCTSRKIAYKGVSYEHTSFGTAQSFGKLRIQHPSGAAVEVDNFANDQVSAVREVKEIVVELNKLKGP